MRLSVASLTNLKIRVEGSVRQIWSQTTAPGDALSCDHPRTVKRAKAEITEIQGPTFSILAAHFEPANFLAIAERILLYRSLTQCLPHYSTWCRRCRLPKDGAHRSRPRRRSTVSHMHRTRKRTNWAAWQTGLRAKIAMHEGNSTAEATEVRGIVIDISHTSNANIVQTSRHTAQTSKAIRSLSKQQRRRPRSRSSTTRERPLVHVVSVLEVALRSSEGGAASVVARHSAVDEALSSVSAKEEVEDNRIAVGVTSVVAEEEATATTSHSEIVMRLFRSSQTGTCLRRLTLHVSRS